MIERFFSWSDAFDACREMGRPIVAVVDDQEAKIFPSGRWEPRNAAAVIAQEEDRRRALLAAEHERALRESAEERAWDEGMFARADERTRRARRPLA